ncbi:MAG: YceI family protein [Acidobacteriota bacterium]
MHRMSRFSRSFGFLVLLSLVLVALVTTSFADDAEDAAVEPPASEAPGELSWAAESDRYQADGRFTRWSFTEIDIPDGDLTKGRVVMEVDLASVWEKADGLVEHLKTADFFEVSKYTTATVEIHDARSTGESTYEATATMTLHGNTKDVPITFTVVGTEPLTIEGTATVSRTAFGIGEPGGSILDEVQIALAAEVPQS